ncbi:MAG: LexA family protein [Alistipes onderdonkii]
MPVYTKFFAILQRLWITRWTTRKKYGSGSSAPTPRPARNFRGDESGVSAGFPSPADDHLDPPLDLNRELIRNPGATFFARVAGDSMQDDGIADGDLLVVDKSLEAYDGCVAVCFLDGEFTSNACGWDRARSSSCPRTSATNRSRSARRAISRYGAW